MCGVAIRLRNGQSRSLQHFFSMWLMIQCPIVLFIRGWISKFYFTTSQVSPPHRNPIALLPYPATVRTVHLHPLPHPKTKGMCPPYLYHKVGTCRYIIMILSRQSHQAMQPSAKLLRLAFSFCWLRLAMISLLRPIRLVLKWKNGRSGTVKISTGRM